MSATIRVCAEWADRHDRPAYTLEEDCPRCDGPTAPAAPASYTPGDPYGTYRRATKRRGGASWSN